MSSKPKKEEYQASELEKTNAAVGAAEKAFFRDNYQPLLTDMRDQSLTEETEAASILKGRASADTAQALSRPSLAATQAVDYQSDLASAALGQQRIANTSAKDIATTMQTGVLGTARGQMADTQSGLAAAARMRRSNELTETANKFATRQAKNSAMAQVAGAAGKKLMNNFKATNNPFKGVKWTGEKYKQGNAFSGYDEDYSGPPITNNYYD